MRRGEFHDGGEFDNVDGYSNDTGFTITPQAQEDFDEAIARARYHQRTVRW